MRTLTLTLAAIAIALAGCTSTGTITMGDQENSPLFIHPALDECERLTVKATFRQSDGTETEFNGTAQGGTINFGPSTEVIDLKGKMITIVIEVTSNSPNLECPLTNARTYQTRQAIVLATYSGTNPPTDADEHFIVDIDDFDL